MGAERKGCTQVRVSSAECAWMLERPCKDADRKSRSRACHIYAEGDWGRKARRDLARPAHEVSCSPLLWGSPLGTTGRFVWRAARCSLSGAGVTCDRLFKM